MGRRCSSGRTASTAAAKRVPARCASGEAGGKQSERGRWPERRVEELISGGKRSGCGDCYGVGEKGETGKMESPRRGELDGAMVWLAKLR